MGSQRDEVEAPEPLLRQALEAAEVGEDPTRQRILDAALAQFEDFGLRRTTMEDVARHAGISRITIYRRFAGKEALVEAVLLRESSRFFTALDAAVADLPTTDERLVEGFAFTLEHLRRHVLLNRLLSTEPEALLPFLTVDAGPILAAAREFLADRLDREIAEGRLPPLDVAVAGELLSRLVLSFLLTPDSVVRLDGPEDAREFAHRYLAPSLHVAPQDGR